MILRDYQQNAVRECHEQIDAGKTRIVIHSGTGTGKTVIAAYITKSAVSLGHRVLFLAHRRELIDQAWKKLDAFGVKAGVLMANDSRRAIWEKVQVASVQTLIRRPNKPNAALVIIDECHRAPADSYIKILESYPDAVVLGLSATPRREDERGLGDLFQVMVSCPSVGEMMRRIDPTTGSPYLVGTRVFAPPSVDLRGVHIVRGEYKADELATVCDKPKIIGNIVENWKKHAGGARTIVFAVGVEHSKHIVAEFLAAGISAEHLDGNTAKETREGIIRRLESGETTVVSNCAVLTEGFDCPAVGCIVLACPTKSLIKYLQMVGRALRPFKGKTVCIVLDHSGATHEHGFVDDDRVWSLEGNKSPTDEKAVAAVRTCKNSVENCWCNRIENHDATGRHMPCHGTFRAGPPKCPYCGCPVPRQEREIEVVDGELKELIRSEQKKEAISKWQATVDDDRKKSRYLELVRIAAERGYKPTQPAVKFKVEFGEWPSRKWTKVSHDFADPDFELGAKVLAENMKPRRKF